jgi:hypothetical protein
MDAPGAVDRHSATTAAILVAPIPESSRAGDALPWSGLRLSDACCRDLSVRELLTKDPRLRGCKLRGSDRPRRVAASSPRVGSPNA